MEVKVQMIAGSDSATKNLAFCADAVDFTRKAFLAHGKSLEKVTSCVQEYFGGANWVIFLFAKAYIGWACSDNSFWVVLRAAGEAGEVYFLNCTYQENKHTENLRLSMLPQPSSDAMIQIKFRGQKMNEECIMMALGASYLVDHTNPKASSVLQYIEKYFFLQGVPTKWCVVKAEDQIEAVGYTIPEYEFVVQMGRRIFVVLRVM